MLLSFGLSAGPTFLRVAQAVVAALGVLAAFALADRIFGRRTAILAALIYALDPLVVISSGLLYPETAASMILPPVALVLPPIAADWIVLTSPARPVRRMAHLGALGLSCSCSFPGLSGTCGFTAVSYR